MNKPFIYIHGIMVNERFLIHKFKLKYNDYVSTYIRIALMEFTTFWLELSDPFRILYN